MNLSTFHLSMFCCFCFTCRCFTCRCFTCPCFTSLVVLCVSQEPSWPCPQIRGLKQWSVLHITLHYITWHHITLRLKQWLVGHIVEAFGRRPIIDPPPLSSHSFMSQIISWTLPRKVKILGVEIFWKFKGTSLGHQRLGAVPILCNMGWGVGFQRHLNRITWYMDGPLPVFKVHTFISLYCKIIAFPTAVSLHHNSRVSMNSKQIDSGAWDEFSHLQLFVK